MVPEDKLHTHTGQSCDRMKIQEIEGRSMCILYVDEGSIGSHAIMVDVIIALGHTDAMSQMKMDLANAFECKDEGEL